MYILRPDEKTTPVMFYTPQSVIRGEVVIKQSVPRINIWLRTDGAPRYLHILKPHILIFGGGPPKPLSYAEIYYPSQEIIAIHTLPPVNEELDYDAREANRTMEEVELLLGTFIMKGKIRISTQTELSASLEMARVAWMSIYDITVSNPHLPQMAPLQVSMALINPSRVPYVLG